MARPHGHATSWWPRTFAGDAYRHNGDDCAADPFAAEMCAVERSLRASLIDPVEPIVVTTTSRSR